MKAKVFSTKPGEPRVYDIDVGILSDVVSGIGARDVKLHVFTPNVELTPLSMIVLGNNTMDTTQVLVNYSSSPIVDSHDIAGDREYTPVPLFVSQEDAGEYTLTNLIGLQINVVRGADKTGGHTKSFLEMGLFLGSDLLVDPGQMEFNFLGNVGTNISNESTSLVNLKELLEASILGNGNAVEITERLSWSSDGGIDHLVYGILVTYSTSSITDINLEDERIISYERRSRDYASTPRIARVVEDVNGGVSISGAMALDNAINVIDVNTRLTDSDIPQYAMTDVLKSTDETLNTAVFNSLKFTLFSSDYDLSIVLSTRRRYDGNNREKTARASLQYVKGWVNVWSGNSNYLMQVQEIDYLNNKILIASNNDITLKGRLHVY